MLRLVAQAFYILHAPFRLQRVATFKRVGSLLKRRREVLCRTISGSVTHFGEFLAPSRP
jgi:hypothetical protein